MKDIELMHGDCLELMKKIPDNSVDIILTDPPYEIDDSGGGKNNDFFNRKLVKDHHINFISHGFDMEKCFEEFFRVCKIPNFLIFCSNKQVSKIMSYFENKKLSTTLLVWNKTNPIPLCYNKYISDVEFIVYAHGHGATFNNETPFEYKKKVFTSGVVSSKNRLHPTQKPIELLTRYIELHSKAGGVVLDPFMGSGSTGIACVNTDRKFIGIELDDNFYNIAERRLTDAVNIKENELF